MEIKHNQMKNLLAILIFVCSIPCAFSKTYYVDSKAGNDANNGTSESYPWQSLTKVNESSFNAGDSILFKRGNNWEGRLAPTSSGSPGKPLVLGAYGKGDLPEIKAAGHFRDALLLKNIEYIDVEYLSLSNFDGSVAYQKTGPTGVRIMAENIGTLHHIRLSHLFIHDVNGDNKKGSAEGTGIFWDCSGPRPSNIEHLTIEDCKMERVDRNGIRGNGTFGIRSAWFPNKFLVIRNCLLDDIGGDGIVIKAFDTALVEHNKLFRTRNRAIDNAVAVWPHSSDHTIIQYNEVAYTKNSNWANDGQSFDIDGNSRNTLIQFNYSHDNDGGFMLVISDLINKDNVKTTGNIIRYNLSVNDGLARKRLFNFAGITDSTLVKGNVFYNNSPKAYTIEVADIEGGIPDHVLFSDNCFQFAGKTAAVFSKSPKQYAHVSFMNNKMGGAMVGQDNLPSISVATGKISKIFIGKLSFPWTYLPLDVKKNLGELPPDLYQIVLGKSD